MKQVASSIKLELAQYRELASFSQFGSDIDAETKKRLDHGEILMEVLKQPQYKPLPVENQVMIIYAAINHYLENVGVENVKNYEKEFLEFMASTYPEVGHSIKSEGKIIESTEENLKAAIEKFNERYLRAIGVDIMQPEEAMGAAEEANLQPEAE
jgi:F-type H+-transporting ATPase subunit alpha